MLPEGWKEVKLGEAVSFLDGKRKPLKSEDRLKIRGQYPYYGATGIIDYVNDYIFDDTLILMGEDGENIISRNLPHVFIISGKTWVNNHAHVLKAKKYCDAHFLSSYLESLNYEKYNTGSAQPKLNKAICESIRVLLPPLPEQQKIAAILSTWDRAIEGTEKLLANSQQQKKALMQQLLTGKKRLPGFTGEWRNTSLYEICILNPKSPHIDESTNISFIPMDGVSNDARICDVTTRAFKKENNGFSYFQEKDVLVAKITPCFENGKGGYLNTLPTQHGFGSTEFHVLRATSDTDGKFIYYITTSERFRILGEMNMQGSAGQKRVPKDFIERFSVNLPPLPEQKAIAAVLTTADEEITAIESDLSRLRQEKKALMQQLLTGKRRVTVD